MEAANKNEAERCLQLARKALRKGEDGRARRLAEKSFKLCPTEAARVFIEQLDNSSSKNFEESSSTGGGGDGGRRRRGANQEKEEEGVEGKDYTKEQKEAVDRVLQCRKDYYEVLGVEISASDEQLKKQYRRLALQLHPDKNRAPQADEAFKAVSTAYTVLKDPVQKKRYDQLGEDGLKSMSGGHTHSFEGGMDPEELFRMFFGSNFMFEDGFMSPYRRSRHSTTRHYHSHDRHHARREPVSGWIQLLQVLPLFIIIFITFLSTFIYPTLYPHPFSLNYSHSYPVKRETKQYSLPYYVQTSFSQQYSSPLAIRRLEREIITEHKWKLREECQKDQYLQILRDQRQGKKRRESMLPKSCSEYQRINNG